MFSCGKCQKKKRLTQKAVLMTAGDKQRTMEKAVNSYFESEQTTNAWSGNCARSQSEERAAPQSLSMDYCAESDCLILLNHLGAVTKE